jgi:hypothetical protein
MPKKRQERLPDAIIPIDNPDKLFHERWTNGRNMLNFPHPFRCCAIGPPNCGKGTVVSNILLRAKPEFEEVYCVHPDKDFTKEWECIGAEMLSEIPAPEQWEGLVKTLVIIDDMELKGLSKEQKRCLDRLFGYCSTHKNISIILCAQDAFNVPPIVRRCANLWVMWKSHDVESTANLARKTSIGVQKFRELFSLLHKPHDSLWIDMTSHSPYPLRKNGFTNLRPATLPLDSTS